ncbi:PIN domain-containing protein [Thiocapsa bogorovii]|uniref:hypothetical protein n=1 Tax=Thiocapsa bogorovii TaxID=521689 RepID=UPI001E44D010|nr:hypothetical protein [Thiocapsa bogorovii]UHD14715.1 hypothetical protein LT988_15650 [Thiocapsa bogorovii]
MYLPDANVVSGLREPKPHAAIVSWLNSVENGILHLATVTRGEIQASVELTRDQDPEKATEIESLLDLVMDVTTY